MASIGEQFLKGKWRRERDCRPTFSGKKQMNSMVLHFRERLIDALGASRRWPT